MDIQIWQHLGIAVGLGLLVGLQREWAVPGTAGIRTFPMITVLGTICAFLSERFGAWILAGGIVALGALLAVANLRRDRDSDAHPGATTEVAGLVMFTVGALLRVGMTAEAIAISGGVTLLLHWKEYLHGFVHRIGSNEIRAVFRLVLIALVILPLLPDTSFGPYEVLNPFRIWLMVVLIVSISLSGYLASRYLGSRTGSVVSGILGGLISSTATTVSYSRRSKLDTKSSAMAALVTMIASTIVFVRVAFEVALVAPSIILRVMPPFGVMFLWMTLVAVVAGARTHREDGAGPEPKDPSNLLAAVLFGGLYALVLLAVAAAKEHFGDRGLYLVAALSGLTDIDAITLSTAQLVTGGGLDVETGWRLMMLGALSNIVFKGGIVAVLGSPRMLKHIAVLFSLSLVGGTVILWCWP